VTAVQSIETLKRELARRLRAQAGITLVMSVGVLGLLTVTGTVLVYYSSTTMRSAAYSNRNSSAYVLAEAGINEMMAILSRHENNALNKYLLGYQPNGTVVKTTSAYEGGTVTWWGILDEGSATWSISSIGETKNPTGASAVPIRRMLTARVPVTPTLSGPLNSPAWNYIYSTRTGNTCDMVISQSVQVASPLYVNGNLCLQNTAAIASGPLVVKGQLTLSQSANAVGSLATPINEAHIGSGCQWKNSALHSLCSPADNVFARVLDASPPQIAAPAADWDGWYRNASPGPYFACYARSGTVPVFDNDQGSLASPDSSKRNASVPGSFNLTPGTSYSCQTAGGELSWNASTRVLTVRGTIFIDGSAQVQNGALNTYQGQGALYLSGTLLVKNSKLCANVAAGGCDSAGWDPNTTMLVVVANGPGGIQVPAGDSVQLVSSSFQGALYGTNAVEIDTTSQAIGPIVGSTVYLGQSTATSFPSVTVAPAGMPGSPMVYAQPNPPQLYGG
jgi:hypothetical protein